MKIGIDARPLQERKRSGVGEYTWHLLDAIFKIDRENDYYIFSNAKNLAAVPLPEGGSNIHDKHFRFPNKTLNLYFKSFCAPRIDSLIGEKLDAFIFPNLNFYALSAGIKKILVVHDLSFSINPGFFSPKSRAWHWAVNAKKMCHAADAITAVSENTKRDLISIFGIPEEKISVIYPGVARMVYDRASLDRVREKYNLPEKFILYLGAVESRKNLPALIRAFKIMKKNSGLTHELVVAGPRGWGADKIRTIDYVDPNDKAALYALAGLFAYPSFYEGFGFPPLEAMSAGTPVVASHAGSLPEVLEDAAVFANPDNPAELAAAMETALTDETLRQNLRNRSAEILKKYSWDKAGQEMLALIKKRSAA
ncbi:MAG: glycosyltransferase family 1 protein [Patescibacteria group bacterium]|nr:glycosyltransferase family 1 protein [Patescibacteria group bacterium]